MNEQSRPAPRRARLLTALALAAGLVAACGGGGGADDTPPQATAQSSTVVASDPAALSAGTAMALGTSSGAPTAVAQPPNTEGRLLASNCFQCHGTLGTGGFDAIRGQDASEVLEFLRKPASESIMAAHAQGYTPAQLQKIIAYLQQ